MKSTNRKGGLMRNAHPKMKSKAGRSSPLSRSMLRIVIDDLLAEYELSHVFHNESDEDIEAVYSFPVPLDAAFGGMDATLDHRTFSASVLAARAAERTYDEAIEQGDSAVLLEEVSPGMLCVNLGNLRPGEQGEIVLRFSAAVAVADGRARFSVPLVQRPRYGWHDGDPRTVPQHDFAVVHPLEADIRVRGLLAGRPVQCSVSGARFAHVDGETSLRLDAAMLDRDLVLVFDLDATPTARARRVEDGDGAMAVANFTLPAAEGDMPLDIALLLDGSGSMTGDAIAQSRRALEALADALRDDDRIHVIRFGSATRALFRRPLHVVPRVRDALRELVGSVESDLGGTEMELALDEAIDALVALDGDRPRAIVLVTDGAVTEDEIAEPRERAAALGVRVFVVAVGSSAGVDVLAPLAQATRGALERAVPAEPIDAGVLRQLHRARNQPVPVAVEASIPEARVLPIEVAYPGDAVTAIAVCPTRAEFAFRIRIGQAPEQVIPAGPVVRAPALRAWAGRQAFLHAESDEAREAIALRYGLISPQTRAVLVCARADDDKAVGLPQIRPVPHMVPHGMVRAAMSMRYGLDVQRVLMACSRDDDRDVPMFLRRSKDAGEAVEPAPELDASTRDELARVLAHALLAGEAALAREALLARIAEPACRDVARAWMEYHDIETADVELLTRLVDEGAELPPLPDDAEAALAVLLAGA